MREVAREIGKGTLVGLLACAECTVFMWALRIYDGRMFLPFALLGLCLYLALRPKK
jgi:hypothetical protein